MERFALEIDAEFNQVRAVQVNDREEQIGRGLLAVEMAVEARVIIAQIPNGVIS